jgi:hypothetical protein
MLALALLALFAQDEDAVRAAVRKALPLLEKSSAQILETKTCFTCHHQALPVLALQTAKARGFDVDEKNLKAQAKYTWDSLVAGKDRYTQGKGQGGEVGTASYALWTLELSGWKPDDTTGLVATYIANYGKKDDPWKHTSARPPSEGSPFTATALAIRSLQTFGTTDQKARIERAREWLVKTKPADTEERVFRLRGLKYAGAEAKVVEAAAAELVATQREDGGWAQLEKLESDAYATGSALFALFESGMKPADEPYRRGLKFLLGSQKEDGTWHVATRSKPIQKYFESGFPHEKDQFISITATGWSVTALAISIREMPR